MDYINVGKKYMKREEYDLAEKCFKKQLEKNASVANYYLGKLKHITGNYDEALEYLGKSKHSKTDYRKAITYQVSRGAQFAIEYLEGSLNTELLYEKEKVLLAKLHNKVGNYERSVKILLTIKCCKVRDYNYILGEAYEGCGDKKNAIRYFTTDKNVPVNKIADLFYDLKEHKRAILYYKAVPSTTHYTKLAICYRHENKIIKAIEYYKLGIKHNNENCYIEYANFLAPREHVKAIEYYKHELKRLCEVGENYRHVAQSIANLYKHIKNFAKAEKYFKLAGDTERRHDIYADTY